MVSLKALMRSSGRRARFAPSCCVGGGQRPGGARHGRYPGRFWRRLLDHLGQLPSQIHRILHTDLEALSTCRVMHVCGVAGQQHPSVAVGRRLPSRIGEPGDPGGTVHPVIRPVDGDERLAEIAQGGLTGLSDVRFGHVDPHRSILQPGEGMDANSVVAGPPFRLLVHLDMSDSGCWLSNPTRGTRYWLPCGQAATSVAPDEVFRPQRLAVRQPDVDTGVILREPHHLTTVDEQRRLARLGLERRGQPLVGKQTTVCRRHQHGGRGCQLSGLPSDQ